LKAAAVVAEQAVVAAAVTLAVLAA